VTDDPVFDGPPADTLPSDPALADLAGPDSGAPGDGAGVGSAPGADVPSAPEPARLDGDGGDTAAEADPDPSPVSVEALLDDVERLTSERDGYLDALRRTQADFENYRKRMMRQQVEEAERLTGRVIEDLLPVLDACDGAVQHGATDVEPVFAALLQNLEKNGLERLDPVGEGFDPNRHEAVMHEPAEDGEDTVVVDVMRRGYAWKGRVLRPAMVKVRG
jgi:molecular chaperone GrpE